MQSKMHEIIVFSKNQKYLQVVYVNFNNNITETEGVTN